MWVMDTLRERLAVGEVTVMTGFADGPDKWSLELSRELGVPSYSYQPSGLIVSGDRTWKWTNDPPPPSGSNRDAWRQWFLHRDRVMVDHLAKRAGIGDVAVLGFVDPLSKTKGTDYTLNYARDTHKLPVERLVYV